MRRALAFVAMTMLFLVTACSTQHAITPLPVQQAGAPFAQGLGGSVVMIGGRLELARDGRSRLPYAKGSSAGCLAAQTSLALLRFSSALFSGNSVGSSDLHCEQTLPKLYLIRLESRHGAALVIPPDGVFSALVPTGTYLVASIADDEAMLPVRLAFQAKISGDAYDLGKLSLNYSGDTLTGIDITSMTSSPNPPEVLNSAIARYAAGRVLGIHKRLPLRISDPPAGTPGSHGQGFYFWDDTSWNSYIAQTIAELKDNGISLLVPAAGPEISAP